MHDPAETWTRVTASTYPQVHTAFNLISGEDHAAYLVPHEYAYGLSQTEIALKQLSDDDRIKLCHGDYGSTVSSDVIVASDILSAFVHKWPILFFRRKRPINGRSGE